MWHGHHWELMQHGQDPNGLYLLLLLLLLQMDLQGVLAEVGLALLLLKGGRAVRVCAEARWPVAG
jgi:hypothetical protein